MPPTTVRVTDRPAQVLPPVRVVDVTPEGYRAGYRSRTYRGGGGGSGNSALGRAGEPTTVYTSELLPNQSFSSEAEKNQAESQYRQQQAQARAQESRRQQDIQAQRQSTVARGSGVVQIGTDTPEGYRQAGITSAVTLPQKIPFTQRVRTFITDPESRAQTVTNIINRPFGRTGERIAGAVGGFVEKVARPFTSAQTGTERTFQSKTEQEIKSFESEAGTYSQKVEGYNKAVEQFNKQYQGRTLTEEEYIRASQIKTELDKNAILYEQKRQTLSAREEQIKQKVENYSTDLIKAKKQAPFFEQRSVEATRAVGGVISSAGFVAKFVGSPSQTQQQLAKELPSSISEFGKGARLDPLGTAVTIGAGLVVGGFIGKVIGKTAGVMRNAKSPTTLSVSVGEINAVPIAGKLNTFRVSGKAVGEVRNLAGQVIGKTVTNTETVTVTARTATEATQSYSRGLTTSLSQAGADTSRLKIGVSSIEGKAEFSPSAVEGLSKGKGRFQISEFMSGKTKPIIKKLPSDVDVVGLRFEGKFPIGKPIKTQTGIKLKLKEVVKPPRGFISKSVEKAFIETDKIRQTLVDTKTLGIGDLGLQLDFTKLKGFRKPTPIKTSASFERDIVNVLKEQKVYDGIPRYTGITFYEEPVRKLYAKPKSSQTLIQSLQTGKRIAEQTGVQAVKSAGLKATQDLQKQLTKQAQARAFKIIPSKFTSPKNIQSMEIKAKQIERAINVQRGAQIQLTELGNKNKYFTGTGFASGLATGISSAQAQVPKLTQLQKSILKQTQTPLGALGTSAFAPTIPTGFNFRGFLFPPFPSRQEGGGSSDINKFRRKSYNPIAKYTASLASAFYQRKPVRVTPKQYKKLAQRRYSGFEMRPVVAIDFGFGNDKDFRKGLSKVNFGF